MTDDPRIEAAARACWRRTNTSASDWEHLPPSSREWWRREVCVALAAADAVDPVRAEDFGALVALCEQIVDTHYPVRTFDGSSGDRGVRFVAAIRRALADLGPQPVPR